MLASADLYGRMFVKDEVPLELGFAVARDRLAQLMARGLLFSTSVDAYRRGNASVARVGPTGLSKLVRVQVRELTETDSSAGLAIRWEATGPGGSLVSVLDADIRLAPDGEDTAMLTLTGAYRAPLGPVGEALDRAILHRVATATIRRFLSGVGASITGDVISAEAATPR